MGSHPKGVFYAFHYYKPPSKSEEEAIRMAELQGIALGGIPTLLTETMSCRAIDLAKNSGIGSAHWHYSNYCDNGFGACITGWGGGNPYGCGHNSCYYKRVSRCCVGVTLDRCMTAVHDCCFSDKVR